ncbi:hypothetical protein FGIG_07930 [Fasciola gigantica]|uniref:Amiloride-sensitive sodium channel n=1 Tax=Fasciola gigantica TaxID=46835 RepID=A0A504YE09_FASGI|nr:hypothetical protein FGIG_07930 [Fasciola gigantica]
MKMTRTISGSSLTIIKRCLHLIIFLLVGFFLMYRIADWIMIRNSFPHLLRSMICDLDNNQRYALSANLSKLLPTEKRMTSDSLDECTTTLILCGLNPVKGSAVFTMNNGDVVYNRLIENRQNNQGNISTFLSTLSDTEYRLITHKMSTMLKSCFVDSSECYATDFTLIRTREGFCYALPLNRTSDVHQVQLILDPEKYDYIIPNDGFIGFRLAVVHANQVKNADAIRFTIVGPHFHTFLDVRHQRGKNCLDEKGSFKQQCPEHHLRAVSQSEKVDMFVQLLSQKKKERFTQSEKAIEFAALVQQRAFLQAYNQTAFHLLMRMVHELSAANQDATNISAMIHELSDRLQQGLQRLDYLILINASFSASSHHIKQKQCLLHINRILWQFSEESKLLLQNPTSSYSDFTSTPLNNETSSDWKRKQMELYLIDSFYGAKSVMSARVILLRKVLKAVMKLKLKFTNITSTEQPNLKDYKTTIDTEVDKSRDCEPVSADFVNILNGIGARASVALSRIDHVNSGLHELLRDNRVVRATYPTYKAVPGQIYLDNLVLVTLQLTEEKAEENTDATLFLFKVFRTGLTSVIINTLTLYIGIFLLLEVAFTRWASRRSCRPKRSQPNNITDAYLGPMELQAPVSRRSFSFSVQTPNMHKNQCSQPCEYCTVRSRSKYRQSDLESLTFVDVATPVYQCRNQFEPTVSNIIPIVQPLYFTDTFVCNNSAPENYATVSVSNSTRNRPAAACISPPPEMQTSGGLKAVRVHMQSHQV